MAHNDIHARHVVIMEYCGTKNIEATFLNIVTVTT